MNYSYDAWGNILWTEDESGINLSSLNPYRYRGYYYDTETGLYYLNSRYYDPRTGRFINADEIEYLGADAEFSCNLYAYCANNPVMYIDVTGHAIDVILDLIFIGWDIYNLIKDEGWKDWKNWAALGIDVVFAVVPFLTGGGGQVVKLINVADNVSDMKKITVIGETMTRVRTVSQFFNAVDNLYDGFKYYNMLKNIGKGGKILAEIGGKISNIFWIYSKVRKGYRIIDIGIDAGRLVRSSSYIAERIFLEIWKKRHLWKIPFHIF